MERKSEQTDKGAQGYQFSSLLLERKSDQTDEGAQGYQLSSLLLKPKSNQKASAHLRWLFAPSIAHEKNALMSRMPFF
ncbi:hypothetical protein [Sphingobacterium sp. NPDC055431]